MNQWALKVPVDLTMEDKAMKCSMCNDELKEYDMRIDMGTYKLDNITLCDECINEVANLIEDYYILRYKEEEEAVVH
jgi:hypothetical protein